MDLILEKLDMDIIVRMTLNILLASMSMWVMRLFCFLFVDVF